jgi:Domain of unknown function (DUF4349)
MSRSDHLDPHVLAELDAIDATLAGEPVDPAHAALAELALLLADTAPQPRPEFTRELDARVARRFAPASGVPAAAAPRARLRNWRLAGLGGAVAVLVAAAVVVTVVVMQPSGNSLNSRPAGTPLSTLHFNATSGAKVGSTDDAAVPAPSGGGRRVQSAQITLTAPNARIDQVTQEVFNVVGQERGSVTNSQVTTATNDNGGSYASFTLSIPTGNLQAAMTRLSELDHTAVTSRTDSSQNVTDQYASDQRKIVDAQVLRTSLLKQLQSATTTAAVTSLEKQINDAEAQLTHDQTALKSLQHRISDSSVSVTVNSGRLPGPRPLQQSHGFTLHRALHDALHVLVVAAGVVLITLAVAIPVGLILALFVWIAVRVRRNRRERTLDSQ